MATEPLTALFAESNVIIVSTSDPERRYQAIHFQGLDGQTSETRYPVNYEELYNLKGRLLTLVDATFTDREQRKAHKDMVWRELKDWMHGIQRAAGEDPIG